MNRAVWLADLASLLAHAASVAPDDETLESFVQWVQVGAFRLNIGADSLERFKGAVRERRAELQEVAGAE